MKKKLAMLLAMVMTFSMTACGTAENANSSEKSEGVGEPDAFVVDEGSNKSASGESDADVFVDFYGVWAEDNERAIFYQEKADEFAKKFEEENGVSVDIKYTYQNGYDGVAEKLTAGSVSHELPVMAQIEESFLYQFYPICEDLSKYISQETIDNYLDGLKVSCYMNDTLYAVPGGRSYVVMYVNNDLLEKAGHTKEDIKTWDDLHTVAADVAALGDNIEGYGIYWDSDCWIWESALYSNGGNVVSDDGMTVTFQNDGAGSTYLKLVKDMLNDGSAYSAYGGSISAGDAYAEKFLNGELGICIQSCTGYGSMKSLMEKEGYQVDISAIDQPAGTAGNSVVTGGSNYIICKEATEAQKRVAAEFLTYLATDENQAEWNALSGYLATTKSSLESEAFEENRKDSNLVQIAEGVKYAHARPHTKHWREMYTYMVEYLEAFAMNPNDYDYDTLVNDMAVYCQSIIDNE